MEKYKISVCVPTLWRPDKLKRLLEAIRKNANYSNYEIIVKADKMPPNNVWAPTMLAECVKEATWDAILFLGNDCIPEPNFMQEAVWGMVRKFPDFDWMIWLSDWYWRWDQWQVSTHWMASKKLLPYLGWFFFEPSLFHCWCDNILQARCEKIWKFSWCEKARLFHDHPINNWFTFGVDELYAQAYGGPRKKHDDKVYKELIKKYWLEDRKW